MPNYICITCGVQYAQTPTPPEPCLICADYRQYVNHDGQHWTTLDDLRRDHRSVFETLEPGLTCIVTEPKFAIGQRPMLVQTSKGNVLWDCNSFIDADTVAAIHELGGVEAIAISHPHFYDSMVEWSRALGDVPIHLPAADKEWVMRPDPNIVFWEGDTHALLNGITVIRCGGHFDGSSVLHWVDGAEGRGLLLTGDTIQVVADRRYVTFMSSYPNQIPMSAKKVTRIVDAVEPFAFDWIYGGWAGKVVNADAKNAVKRSAERYIRAISD